MKVGIVGFRGSGKTTVFNALTGLHAEVGGFHGEESKNLGIIKVPDERLLKIHDAVKPKKLVQAEIAFADLAAASPASGKGFSPKTLAEMRVADALVHVVRGFDNPEVSEDADLRRDVERFESEMALADLIVVENRLERMRKQGAKGQERDLLEELKLHLEQELPIRTFPLTEDAKGRLAGFTFLSEKPCLVLLNVSEGEAASAAPANVAEMAKARGLRLLVISGQVEMELNELDDAERAEYLASLGLTTTAKNRFIREAYDMLELIAFFTFGPDEVRAWPIRKGTRAQQAAGKIHSDIERGFIRAEVMQWQDVVALPHESKLREAGKIKLEGKEYIPQDGEVIHFRFNV